MRLNINVHTISIFFPILIFIVNPLFGLLISIFFAIQYKFKSSKIILIVLISFFLGLINTTKILESDLEMYEGFYQLAKSITFFQFQSEYNKEPIFYFIMYFFSKVLDIKFKYFVLFLTFIAYLLFLTSIFNFHNKIKSNKFITVFSILVGAFFFELFSLSAHLIRQFLATSILLYYIIQYIFYEKNKWWLLLIAMFTHTSVYFFLPFLFLKTFKKRIQIKDLLVVILVSLPIFFYFEKIIIYFSQNLPSILGYVFTRMIEGNFEDLTGSVKSITIIINTTTIIMILYYYFFSQEKNNKIIHILNIFISLIAFTFIVIDLPMISYRYSFYIYFLPPFIIPLLLRMKYIKPFSYMIQVLIIGIMLFRFGYKLENGPFKYEGVENIYYKNTISYFIKI